MEHRRQNISTGVLFREGSPGDSEMETNDSCLTMNLLDSLGRGHKEVVVFHDCGFFELTEMEVGNRHAQSCG